MRSGIIISTVLNLWDIIKRKWNDSFSASIVNKIGNFLIKSFENSFIISKILEYKNGLYSESLLNRLIQNLIEFIRKLLSFINKILTKPIKGSMTYSISNYLFSIVKANPFQLLCISIGTASLTYGSLSFAAGKIGMLKLAIFLIASFILGFLGFVNIDVKALLSESKFITILRNFFDYYS